MAKQYTFKTTRDTEWLEPILDNISRLQRSAVIRDYIIQGIRCPGSASEITHTGMSEVSDKTQMTDKTEVFVTPITESSIIDIDARLDNLKF